MLTSIGMTYTHALIVVLMSLGDFCSEFSDSAGRTFAYNTPEGDNNGLTVYRSGTLAIVTCPEGTVSSETSATCAVSSGSFDWTDFLVCEG